MAGANATFMGWLRRSYRSVFLIFLPALFIMPRSAWAHPHVWVTYETTIVYDKGTVTGVGHIWTFDDMYTAMAIQGLDTNKDGTYSREELAELTKINVEGLKEFNYFTDARLGAAQLKVEAPKDAWLEHKNNILRLHFFLPLDKPVLADAEGLTIAISDPSFFIAFEPEQTDALKLAAAPEGCAVAFVDPSAEKSSADAQKLGEALAQEFNGPSPDQAGGQGFSSAKTIAVTCKRS